MISIIFIIIILILFFELNFVIFVFWIKLKLELIFMDVFSLGVFKECCILLKVFFVKRKKMLECV